MSPWGNPDSRENLWCVCCGAFGVEWVERATWLSPNAPTQRVRLCPPCAQAGWSLVGPKEVGAFWLRQRPWRVGGPRIDEKPDAAPTVPAGPALLSTPPARRVRRGESGRPAPSRVFAEDAE